MRSPLLIVDGDNLAHRAYHSTPKSIKGPGGSPINAISGFFSMLSKVWLSQSPRGVFVAWDTLGVDTYRSKIWPAYQTGRVFEYEIVEQLNILPEVCSAFGMAVGKQAGFEADDLMASATKREVSESGTCLLYTTDRDSYQLISPKVSVLTPRRGAPAAIVVGEDDVVRELGVLPTQVVDFKAIAGDSSDRIPGIKGIGQKGAAALLLKHGSLESVIANWDAKQADLALRFQQVVRMRDDLVVELPSTGPDWGAGAEVLRGLGAEGLANRFQAFTGATRHVDR